MYKFLIYARCSWCISSWFTFDQIKLFEILLFFAATLGLGKLKLKQTTNWCFIWILNIICMDYLQVYNFKIVGELYLNFDDKGQILKILTKDCHFFKHLD